MPEWDDKKLLEGIKTPGKEELAFNQLVIKYQERLYWHIRKIVITYEDVVEEVAGYLRSRVGMLVKKGVDASAIAIDPGIGFGKTVAHNLELIGSLEVIAGLGRPVVLGASRKSFLGVIAGIETPADRDGPTAVTTALGYERGARVFRVHDVVSSRAALAVTGAIVAPQQWDEWLQG